MAAATVRTPQSQRKSEKGISGFFRYLWKHKYMYLMLVPAIAFYVIFCYVPMYGATMAFKDFNPMLGIWASPWVGFEHFEQLFALDKFYSCLLYTSPPAGGRRTALRWRDRRLPRRSWGR